jgi:hypothetical protein
VAVDSLQKTGETGARSKEGRFAKGVSGNPDGRPRGSKNRALLVARSLLEGEAEALMRKAIEMALGGDIAALRLCLTRVAAPRRASPVQLDLPPLDTAADLAGAMAALTAAAAEGAITPGEALELSRVIDTFLRALDARTEERQRQWREEAARRPAPPRDPSARW